ncbi:MAG: ribonuclease HIII [Chlamydiota bacterium]
MSKKSSCFSTKIALSLKDKLLRDLESQGFEISTPNYTLFSAKKKGVSCTLYTSGSLTVQGKEKDSFIEFYLEPEILHDFSYSHPTANVDKTARIGSDEAGKGDYFGPIVVASVYADQEGIETLIKLGVKDSKTFSDKKVTELAEKIRADFDYEIVRIMPPKYNELYAKFKNLNRFLAWMHTAAIKQLSEKSRCSKVIVDKFAHESLMDSFFKQAKLSLDLEQRVRAEEDVVVAAASIVARSAFLSSLRSLGEPFGKTLPKGASQLVVKTGKEIVRELGIPTLDTLSKNHFKTRSVVIS